MKLAEKPYIPHYGQIMLKPRHQKLLEELPKNGYKVYPSAVKAGYSPNTANKNPNRLLKSALHAQAKEVMKMTANNIQVDTKELKQTLAELIGMSREDVFLRLKTISLQDKDLSSALKVLAPLAKDLGVNLNTDEAPKVVVPVLNIGVRSLDNGSIEPPIDDVS